MFFLQKSRTIAITLRAIEMSRLHPFFSKLHPKVNPEAKKFEYYSEGSDIAVSSCACQDANGCIQLK